VRDWNVSQVSVDRGHSAKLASFVENDGQALLRFAYMLTAGRADVAQDLVQDVLLNLAARGVDDLDEIGPYARRAVINAHRSLGRRAKVRLQALARLSPPADATSGCSAAEARLVVLQALSQLGYRERAAVVMRYLEDLPDEEIGLVLGVSRSTVRSLIHRALPKLRARISMDEG
jgi:RNA polymerase sigma factor (sigma-70 family)